MSRCPPRHDTVFGLYCFPTGSHISCAEYIYVRQSRGAEGVWLLGVRADRCFAFFAYSSRA